MRLIPAVLAAMLSLSPTLAWSQDHNHAAGAPAAQGATHDHAAMMAAEQAKADAALDEKLAKMEKAKGNEKVTLMADILKQLVAEHKANAAGHATAAAPAAGHDHGSAAAGEGAGEHAMGSCPMCVSMHGSADSAMKHDGAGAMACPMMAQH